MNMFKTTIAKSATEYISMQDEPRRSQLKTLHELILKTLPTEKPFILSGMIGYGKFHYESKSGREGDWALIMLANQKNYMSLYICAAEDGKYLAEKYKSKLPKADIGRSCIRFKKIDDLDLDTISEILTKAKKLGGFGSS
jgi:hypothetical protein